MQVLTNFCAEAVDIMPMFDEKAGKWRTPYCRVKAGTSQGGARTVGSVQFECGEWVSEPPEDPTDVEAVVSAWAPKDPTLLAQRMLPHVDEARSMDLGNVWVMVLLHGSPTVWACSPAIPPKKGAAETQYMRKQEENLLTTHRHVFATMSDVAFRAIERGDKAQERLLELERQNARQEAEAEHDSEALRYAMLEEVTRELGPHIVQEIGAALPEVVEIMARYRMGKSVPKNKGKRSDDVVDVEPADDWTEEQHREHLQACVSGIVYAANNTPEYIDASTLAPLLPVLGRLPAAAKTAIKHAVS